MVVHGAAVQRLHPARGLFKALVRIAQKAFADTGARMHKHDAAAPLQVCTEFLRPDLGDALLKPRRGIGGADVVALCNDHRVVLFQALWG